MACHNVGRTLAQNQGEGMANILGAHPGSASWERIPGAQASLPACFGQSALAGNPAGKDACAPRQFALPFLRRTSNDTENQSSMETGRAPGRYDQRGGFSVD